MIKVKQFLDAIDEVNSIISGALSMESAVNQIVRALGQIAGVLNCAIYFASDEPDHLLDFGSDGSSVIGEQAILLSERALRERQLLWEEQGIGGASQGSDTIIVIAAPIVFAETSKGVLTVIKEVSVAATSEKAVAADLIFAGIISDLLAHAHQIFSSENHTRTIVNSIGVSDVLVQGVSFSTQIRGNSKAIRKVFEQILQVAPSTTTALILGESGVGKELVADAIHRNSGRADRSFVKLNCAALPESLLESEIFGHEKGSFTGAISQKKGRFELAHGGTLFLDEIGEISLATQLKLLRFLQEKEFERVGGIETISADVRIVAATNRDLEEMIDKGLFRLDLYYRLNVFPIYVPSIRERKPDIIPIADHFIEKYSRILNKNVRRISSPAIDLLVSYHWPGNVRELENCIERAVLMVEDNVIQSRHLPPSLQAAEAHVSEKGSLAATLASVEIELICEALKGVNGNMAKASRKLGLTERVMGLRVKKHQIDPKKFKG